MKAIRKILIYFIGLNLVVLGLDKFFKFMPEACTLMTNADQSLLYGIGVAESILGVLLFFGKYTRTILILIFLLMAWAVGMHLMNDTYDIGGAIFLGVLCLIPLFLKEKNLDTSKKSDN